jgi:hypothetical protein
MYIAVPYSILLIAALALVFGPIETSKSNSGGRDIEKT